MSLDAGAQGNQRQRDDLFRLLIASVKDYAIFHLDPGGHIQTWNEGAQRIKGYSADGIIGKHFSIFYPPEDVRRGKIEHALRVAKDVGRWEDEGWRVREDGTQFWANVVITALFDSDGQLVGFGKVTRVLTERRQAEEERVQLLARERTARAEADVAEAKLRAQDEFLAVAAHELKTPMASAKATSQLLIRRLERGGGDPQRMQQSLRTIDRQIDRLARLVTQLLETVRLQAGRLSLQRERTNVAELVLGAVEQAQATTDSHQLVFRSQGDVWAWVDALRVEQVITNLLDNAIKYSPAGGPIDIEVTYVKPDRVRVAVRDRGLGVPVEHRPRLFERFYQAHADTYQSGLGLGLYLCHEFVELHEGTLVAEFPPDGGTRFVVTLPVRRSAVADGDSATSADE